MNWFFIMSCTAAVAFAQEPQKLRLDDAVRAGRLNSRSLQASGARAEGAAARATEVRAALFPSIKAQAGYRRLSDVDPFAVKLPISPVPFVISPTVLNNYTLGVIVQQPLFAGLRLQNASRAASLQADASASDTQAEGADLVLNIKTAYWGLYQARQLDYFVGENVTRLEADEQDARRLMNAGTATRNDLLRVQVQLSNARLARIDASNDVELAMMALNNLIGQPVETRIELTSMPDTTTDNGREDAAGAQQREVMVRAKESRADLHASKLRAEAADASLSAARGAWWPQIMLMGGYAYNRPNARYLPTRDEFKGTWDIGVQLQFDVWNWGATGAQVDQANAALRQSKLQLDQASENVALEVRRSLLAVERARQKVAVARVALDQSDENVRMTRDKFKAGLATSTDLLDAEVSLLQARTGLTGAFVELEVAKARREKAIGAER